jgi:hypothetical protein
MKSKPTITSTGGEIDKNGKYVLKDIFHHFNNRNSGSRIYSQENFERELEILKRKMLIENRIKKVKNILAYIGENP